MIACLLRRDRKETFISGGDGQAIWLGRVEERGGRLVARYRLVMDISGVLRGKPEKEAKLFIGKDFIVFKGDIYDLARELSLEDFESYISECKAEEKRERK